MYRVTSKKALALICLVSTCGGTAFAQSASQLEEIVVTAQKRSQSIQDVPISMVALGDEDMRKLGIERASEVLNFIPNASTHLIFGDSQFNFYIRGVGDSNFHVNSIASVGVYADEVSLNSAPTWGFSSFDLERVEVLRGPQNTLFGRNTTGGAIVYVANKPVIGESLNGRANLTYGRFNKLKYDAAIGLPAGDNWAFRFSILGSTQDGVQENLFLGGDDAEQERYAARAQALWEPNENFSALLTANYGVDRSGNRRPKSIGTQDPLDPTQVCSVSLADLGLGQPCGDGGGFVDTADNREVFGNMPNPMNDIDVWGGSAKLDWNFDNMTFSSISSYVHNEMQRSEDADAGPHAFFELHQGTDVDQISQEFRLVSSGESSMNWIAGVLYFSEDAYLPTVIRRTPLTPPDPAGALPGSPAAAFTILPSTIISQDDESLSAYGQIELDLTDAFAMTAGLRLSREEKTGVNDTFVGVGAGIPFGTFFDEELARTNIIASVGVTPLVAKTDEWGGKIGLTYTAESGSLLYGSVSRGFKSGGFSAAALQALIGEAAREVRPESLLTYEVGYKGEFLDNSLTTNVAVFYNDWDDMQVFSVLLEQGVLLPLLLNVPQAASWGAEIETRWNPADGWLVQLGLGLLDSELKDTTDLPAVSVGNELPYAPGLSFDGLVRRHWDVADGVLSVQVDFHYEDEQTYDLANKVELSEDSHNLLNARIEYEFDRYRIGLWGQNLTEESYCVNKLDFRGPAQNIKCVTNNDFVMYGLDFNIEF